jgi:S-adenosylmethionine-diacylglycerol 3-amino-3-carboxypropyl transferase
MSKYFQGLNYSLANEDTWIEYNLAPLGAKSFFSVCGSGSRVSPLLAKNPQEMHVVDLSETQLKLFRLRFQAARTLSYQEYLHFLGYTNSPDQENRSHIIEKLKLSSEDLHHWKAQEHLWQKAGFIYLGKWESHFMKLGKIFKKISFSDLGPVFAARNMDEQREAVKKYWKPAFFKRYTQIVMNEWIANKLLYKGSFAGGKDNKTMSITAAQFIYDEFNDLFQNTWVRSNYFLQMIFLNEVAHPEAFPAECNEEIFEGIKNCQTKIYYHKENLLKLLRSKPHDFYSLSDTFSYMSNEEVKDFLRDLPEEVPQATNMVIRTFMRKPSFEIVSPWETNVGENHEMAKNDCTRMYEFTILKKRLSNL